MLPYSFAIPSILQASEFWSAITGAIVGGLIAYFIQIKALREGRRDRADDRLRIQKGLANSLMFKMFRVQSNLRIIHQHILKCLKAATTGGRADEELWQIVSPMGNPPPPVRFTAEEMSMLLEQKDNDVFNEIASMDENHNAIVEMVALYKDERTKLTDLFPPPAGGQGQMLFGFYTKQQWLALRPQMINVNSVVEQLQAHAAESAKKAEEALGKLEALLKKQGLIAFKVDLKPFPA